MATPKPSSRDAARRAGLPPVVLCILDGWGYRDNGADNAIDKAPECATQDDDKDEQEKEARH